MREEYFRVGLRWSCALRMVARSEEKLTCTAGQNRGEDQYTPQRTGVKPVLHEKLLRRARLGCVADTQTFATPTQRAR